jgi:ribose-phosphate pyrophosphokinase
MISTGGTQKAAIDALIEAGCEPEITVAASHGLFAGSAEEDLRGAPVERFIVTDSVPPPEGLGLPLEVVGLAPLLAKAIDRLHNERSLDEIIEHA